MNYVNDEKTLANFADNDKFYSDRMENRISPESSLWNPWHGCHKLSTGCRHCYVYRGDSKHGKDSSIITKTGQFNLPVRRKKDKTYKIPSGNLVYTCFTSDFLIEEADEWRIEAWKMMRERYDLHFLFITKRIDRLGQCLPPDWGDGYDNVTICCTMENQDRVDYRLPLYKAAPVKHKIIICEPLLSAINFKGELGTWVEQIVVGGESGKEARICNYDWVLDIRRQCIENNISFWFKQTGYRLLKGEREYKIARQSRYGSRKYWHSVSLAPIIRPPDCSVRMRFSLSSAAAMRLTALSA